MWCEKNVTKLPVLVKKTFVVFLVSSDRVNFLQLSKFLTDERQILDFDERLKFIGSSA